jgi:hypothetical protein
MVTLLARTKFCGGGHRLSELDPATLHPPLPEAPDQVPRPPLFRTRDCANGAEPAQD